MRVKGGAAAVHFTIAKVYIQLWFSNISLNHRSVSNLYTQLSRYKFDSPTQTVHTYVGNLITSCARIEPTGTQFVHRIDLRIHRKIS